MPSQPEKDEQPNGAVCYSQVRRSMPEIKTNQIHSKKRNSYQGEDGSSVSQNYSSRLFCNVFTKRIAFWLCPLSISKPLF